MSAAAERLFETMEESPAGPTPAGCWDCGAEPWGEPLVYGYCADCLPKHCHQEEMFPDG
jgi:hypothetical protein